MMTKAFLVVLAALLITSSVRAAENAQGFSVQGQLLDASDIPLTGPVAMNFKILSPNDCVLYEEQQPSVSLTGGAFSTQVGSGTGDEKRTGGDLGLSMAAIFNNGAAPIGTSQQCPAGYTASAGDPRYLRITVDGVTLAPDQVISSAPQAWVAETLQGKAPADFVQVSSSARNAGSGAFGINTAAPAAQVHVTTSGGAKGLVVQGSAGQTANLFETRSAGGTLFSYFDGNGMLFLPGDPTLNNQACTKAYVDSKVTAVPSEAQYLTGVTSNIQTQLASKEPTISTSDATKYYRGDKTWALLDTSVRTAVAPNAPLFFDASNNFTLTLANKLGAAQTLVKVNVDTKGLVTGGQTALAAADLPALNSAGDLTGSIVTPTVAKIQGKPVSATAPTDGQLLKFNGTSWVPFTLTSGRTSCPLNYSLVGTAGDGAFCISTAPQGPAASWNAAILDCANKSPRARLCRMEEWMMACELNAFTRPSGNAERTSALETYDDVGNEAYAFDVTYTAGSGCHVSQVDSVFDSTVRHRCCLQ